MNVNFELYKIFYEVATIGNITKASNKLNISQPAISKSIKNLEEQLGGTLFIRTKRGVILTDEGKIFYDHIKNAILDIEGAEKEFTNLINLDTGIIRIGISTTITENYLLDYLKEFNELYPNIAIQIYTDISSELINKLRTGLLDIIIVHFIDKEYPLDIDIHKIKKIHSCFVVNNKYQNLLNKEISIKELNNYPLILQIKGSNSREAIDFFAKSNNIVLNNCIELSSYTLISEFAKIGLGIGLSTKEYIKEDLNNKLLYEIKLKEELPSRYIGYATIKNKIHSSAIKKFIELINKTH